MLQRHHLPQLPSLPNIPKRALVSARRLVPKMPMISKRKTPKLDVLIIGAGISGVDMASHIKRDKVLAKSIRKGRVAIVEKRDDIGGTWDLFKYPGIRSDSDMFTLGFAHRPWLGKRALTDGHSIKRYIKQAVDADGIGSLIQYQTEVTKLVWSSQQHYWTATLTDVKTGKTSTVTSRFVVGATGYYDYDQGYQPEFDGEADFAGQIIHPQKWTDDIRYHDKRVVIIGSGATAVTLLPALLDGGINPQAEGAHLNHSHTDDGKSKKSQTSVPSIQQAAHVTMLQRSPTYVASVPSSDDSFDTLTKKLKLSQDTAYAVVRWKNILTQQGLYRFSRIAPKPMKLAVTWLAKKELKGSGVDIKHFLPSYNPWDERFCAVPDGDMFAALHTDRADVVTDHIERFTKTGIKLKSGRHLEADIIITATGLKLQMLGGAQVYMDDTPVDVGSRMTYKAVLVEGVPNMAVLFGYTNSSWTLKIDLACHYVVRLLRHMHHYGYETVAPTAKADDGELAKALPDTVMGALSAGYIRRAKDVLPKQGDRYPWQVTNNYPLDIVMLKYRNVADKWLKFGR